MKQSNASPPRKGAGQRVSSMRIPQVPMEWMDPLSWRLPSGKALAEFALQAGFLAPLMLGTPSFSKRRKKPAPPQVEAPRTGEAVTAGMEPGLTKLPLREEPDQSGTFRGTR